MILIRPYLWCVEYLFACFPVVCLCWLLVVLVGLAHHLGLHLLCLFLFWPSCSYHDIVTTPEWIPVHLHRVQIGVRIAALGLSIKRNVRMYQYKIEVVNLLTKVGWKLWLKQAEQEVPDSRSYRHSSRSGVQRLILAPRNQSLRCNLQHIRQQAELTDSRVLVFDLSPSPDPSIQM